MAEKNTVTSPTLSSLTFYGPGRYFTLQTIAGEEVQIGKTA